MNQRQHRLLVIDPSTLPPEQQVKTFTLSYPQFCLLIGLVAERTHSSQHRSGEWRQVYLRLGGSL